MSEASAFSSSPAAGTTGGDSPSVAGGALRARVHAQRRALRVLAAHFVLTVVAITTAATTAVLMFIISFPDALSIGAYSAATIALSYGALTFPRRAVGVALGAAASAAVLWVSSRYHVDALITWTAVGAAAWTTASVFNTRRSRRSPYLPASTALAVTPLSLGFVSVLDWNAWLWALPAGAAGLAAVAWRAEWIVTFRARRAAVRSHIKYRTGYHLTSRPEGDGRWMNEANLEVGADAEALTAAQLSRLGDPWHVLHSRSLHNTAADADHIVIGPGGVVLVDSKYRSGHFECHPWVAEDGTTGADWAYNGAPVTTDLVGSALFEADKIAWAFHADDVPGQPVPVVLAIHGARMNIPWGELIIEFTAQAETEGDPNEQQVTDTKTVTLVDATHLTEYLRQLPARRFTSPSKRESAAGEAAGHSLEEIELAAQRRYIRDLATVAEHLFVPVSAD